MEGDGRAEGSGCGRERAWGLSRKRGRKKEALGSLASRTRGSALGRLWTPFCTLPCLQRGYAGATSPDPSLQRPRERVRVGSELRGAPCKASSLSQTRRASTCFSPNQHPPPSLSPPGWVI